MTLCACVIDLEGHIWCRLHCAPPGHWGTPQSFLRRFTRVPRAEWKHHLPSPISTATLHIGDHITTTGGGACVYVCGFRLRRCPCAHPRTTPGPKVPVGHRLYCLRACAWAQSMHIWVCERERRCEQEETHKGAESLARHTYDETQSGWLTESVRGGATVAVTVFKESKSQRDLPIRWGHSSSHIDFGGLSKSDFPLRAAETGSAIHPFVSVCVHAQQRDNTGK